MVVDTWGVDVPPFQDYAWRLAVSSPGGAKPGSQGREPLVCGRITCSAPGGGDTLKLGPHSGPYKS